MNNINSQIHWLLVVSAVVEMCFLVYREKRKKKKLEILLAVNYISLNQIYAEISNQALLANIIEAVALLDPVGQNLP